jgi:hypothetical protein
VATIDRYSDFGEALRMANDSKFGLQAGSSPRRSGAGSRRRRTLEFGGVLINEVPTFRADQMPYGGVKDSGNTREGPAFAVYRADRGALRHLPGLSICPAPLLVRAGHAPVVERLLEDGGLDPLLERDLAQRAAGLGRPLTMSAARS